MSDSSPRSYIARYAVRGALLGIAAGVVILILDAARPEPQGIAAWFDFGPYVYGLQLGLPASMLLPIVFGPETSDWSTARVAGFALAAPALGWAFWGAALGLIRARMTSRERVS